MLEWLRAADERLFHKINAVWTHPWLDAAFPYLTDLHKRLFFWVAASIGLLAWLQVKKGKALKVLLAGVLSVALMDMTSHRIIKRFFQRPRPQKAGLSVVLRTQPHLGYSFPSNHAANSFAAATVLSAAHPLWAAPAFLGAILVAYSRVYVGVHYPFDVLAGALLGFLMARLVIFVLRRLGF